MYIGLYSTICLKFCKAAIINTQSTKSKYRNCKIFESVFPSLLESRNVNPVRDSFYYALLYFFNSHTHTKTHAHTHTDHKCSEVIFLLHSDVIIWLGNKRKSDFLPRVYFKQLLYFKQSSVVVLINSLSECNQTLFTLLISRACLLFSAVSHIHTWHVGVQRLVQLHFVFFVGGEEKCHSLAFISLHHIILKSPGETDVGQFQTSAEHLSGPAADCSPSG